MPSPICRQQQLRSGQVSGGKWGELLRQYSVSADTGAFEILQSSSRLPGASTLQSLEVRAARAGTCMRAPACRQPPVPCVPVRAFLDIVHAILLRLRIRNCTSQAAGTPGGRGGGGGEGAMRYVPRSQVQIPLETHRASAQTYDAMTQGPPLARC